MPIAALVFGPHSLVVVVVSGRSGLDGPCSGALPGGGSSAAAV